MKHISVEVSLRELYKHILQQPHFPNGVVQTSFLMFILNSGFRFSWPGILASSLMMLRFWVQGYKTENILTWLVFENCFSCLAWIILSGNNLINLLFLLEFFYFSHSPSSLVTILVVDSTQFPNLLVRNHVLPWP